MIRGSKEYFQKNGLPKLMEELGTKSPMSVPRLKKVTLNMGLGEAKNNKNLVTEGLKSLTLVAGQKAVPTAAKIAIAGFKIREGLQIGAMTTLRRERMYSFISRLVNVYLPRVKDFHGLSPKSFDGRGNYSIGINDPRVFPELGATSQVRGLSITFVTGSGSDQKSLKMLEHLGLPFAKKK